MKVSVIMPYLNMKAYVYAAVKSVFDQTYKNVELIIVNSGPEDELEKVARDFPCRIIHAPETNRVSKARNIALEASRGTLIQMLDADDILLPNKLEICAELLRRYPNVGVVYHNCHHIDESGRIIMTKHLPDWDARQYADHNFHAGSSIWLTRKGLATWDEEITYGDDYQYILDCTQHTNVLHVSFILSLYRWHKGSMSLGARPTPPRRREIDFKRIRAAQERFKKARGLA